MAGVVLRDTNAALNSVWGGQREKKVTPRRGHYQQYGPQTRILLKDFFLLTASECAPEDSNGLERGMRRIFFLCS